MSSLLNSENITITYKKELKTHLLNLIFQFSSQESYLLHDKILREQTLLLHLDLSKNRNASYWKIIHNEVKFICRAIESNQWYCLPDMDSSSAIYLRSNHIISSVGSGIGVPCTCCCV